MAYKEHGLLCSLSLGEDEKRGRFVRGGVKESAWECSGLCRQFREGSVETRYQVFRGAYQSVRTSEGQSRTILQRQGTAGNADCLGGTHISCLPPPLRTTCVECGHYVGPCIFIDSPSLSGRVDIDLRVLKFHCGIVLLLNERNTGCVLVKQAEIQMVTNKQRSASVRKKKCWLGGRRFP